MKNSEMTNSLLSDYCRWNQVNKVEELLKNSTEDIDVIYNDGILFQLAISARSSEMLKTLLQYFEKTKLQSDPDTLEYKISKHKLINILQEAIDAYEASDEIKSILSQYISEEENSDTEEELEDFEISSICNNNEIIGNVKLTADNLRIFSQQQEQPENIVLLGEESTDLFNSTL